MFKDEQRIRRFIAAVASLDPTEGDLDRTWDDPEEALFELPILCAEAREIINTEGQIDA